MKTVLVIGSLNMDYVLYCDSFPRPGETLVAKERIIRPGGKGANQAAAIAKSKLAHAVMLGSIGNDNDGRLLRDTLIGAGVEPEFQLSDKPTGTATILVNAKGENEILIDSGANATLHEIPAHLIDNCDCLLLQNEIPMEANLKAMEIAKSKGKTIVYNPAPAIKGGEACIRICDIVIVNETELATYGKTGNLDCDIDKLLALGPAGVLVTLGERGSIYKGKEGEFAQKAYPVEAVDTVGAGDTYVGYFISALMNGSSVPEAMDIASKASAIAVTRKGSIEAIPFGDELE